jgi:GAF domain-containing protein
MELFEQAMELARQHGYINNEALAGELYARFWLDQGRTEIAEVCLRKALSLYEAWGARGKVAELRARHGRTLAPEPPPESAPKPPPSPAGPASGLGMLDLMTVLQAGQALASERELDRVIERLMRIVVASAGATRGFLILPRDGALLVEARMAVDPDVVELGVGDRVEARSDLAHAVVHYVARTREPVVLGSAALDPRFSGDPHIAAGRARSLLCLALSYQGRLSGLVYLENQIAEDAFTRDRIKLLELVSAQAAIAVENALLYAHLSRMSDELRTANERLEAEVASRTEDLRRANDRLLRELSERERAEQARAELHEQIIRMQERQLQELSTPLIPITSDVLVMPLIGTMDARRAGQVLELALAGATERRARAVILDLTGLRHADAEVAGALLRAASALRLLGTEAILTGMRAEIARTLVDLGADLGQVVIRGTLQSGIAYASSRRGGR